MNKNVAKVVGIDPGLTGALAFVSVGGDLIVIEDMPHVGKEINAHLIARLILGYGPIRHAVVELAHTMPRQGISSAFNYGTGYGKILGVLAALDVPITHLPAVGRRRCSSARTRTCPASVRWNAGPTPPTSSTSPNTTVGPRPR